MTSLTQQMETLQKLNENQNKSIKKYKSKDSKYTGKYELQQTNLMTAPRFEVILEILKKQHARICQLEDIIKVKNNVQQGPHSGESWNYM